MVLDSRLLFALSFLIVAFGAPSLSWGLSMAAASFGYALFWHTFRGKFWIGVAWFTAVQAVQLNWLASTHYMGPLIVVVYAFVSFAIGVQFGCLTFLAKGPLGWRQMAGLSGFWVLMEWIRLFFLSGFTWNPIGLSLAANDYSIQFSSLFGVYGHCFWVIFTNLIALKDKRLWVCVALLPYIFGYCHQTFWESRLAKEMPLSVALVQTALRPEQRDLTRGKREAHIHPLLQWDRILSYFKEAQYDLIVFPEGALPGGVKRPIYPLAHVHKIWSKFSDLSHFPVDGPLYSQELYGTNALWLQSLSNHFGSDVIVGLDDGESGAMYNAAFHFVPGGDALNRYEKQILIPVGEYVPLSFLNQFFYEQFGIAGSFDSGKKTTLFAGKVPMGISICLEETYGELVRDARKKGAKLFVNITNDVWFPQTRLPWHHFDHGRLRAAENGVYLLRSCNTGVTAVINCFGKSEAQFPVSDTEGGILSAKVTAASYPTLYTFWGDAPILLLSLFLVGLGLIQSIVKKKLLEYGFLG